MTELRERIAEAIYNKYEFNDQFTWEKLKAEIAAMSPSETRDIYQEMHDEWLDIADEAIKVLGEELAWSPVGSQTFFRIVDEDAHESARIRNEQAQESADKQNALRQRTENKKAREEDREPRQLTPVEPTVYVVYRRIPAQTAWELV